LTSVSNEIKHLRLGSVELVLPGVGRMSAFEQFRAVVNTGWVLAKLVDVLLHLLGC
jgi:hypothetical protein